jgi:hypothetical protein
MRMLIPTLRSPQSQHSLTFGGLLPHHHYLLLACYFSLISVGNHALYVVSQATNLRNWGQQHKGLAIGLPIAFFGLSAAVYDAVAYTLFADDSGRVRFFDFFLFIALSALVVDGVAVFFLRDYRTEGAVSRSPLPSEEALRSGSPGRPDTPSADLPLERLLKHRTPKAEGEVGVDHRLSEALLEEGAEEGNATSSASSVSSAPPRVAFFTSLDTYLIGLSMIAVIGAGQMYITNVGAIILSLSGPGASASSSAVQQAQGVHVALISISSFTGRLAIGCLLDYFHARHGVPRALWSLLGASCMLAGHLLALGVVELPALPLVTCLISVGYGMLWTSSPVLVSELYGNAHFAFYWGSLTLLPAMSGFLTNVLFGIVYDGAARAFAGDVPSPQVPVVGVVVEGGGSAPLEEHGCLDPACFHPSFRVTSVLAAVGVLAAGALVRRTWGRGPSSSLS